MVKVQNKEIEFYMCWNIPHLIQINPHTVFNVDKAEVIGLIDEA